MGCSLQSLTYLGLLYLSHSVEAVPRRVNRVVEVVVRGLVDAFIAEGVSIIHPVLTLLFRPLAEWDDLSGRGVDDLASPFHLPIKDGVGLGEPPIGEGGSDIVLAVNRVAVVVLCVESAVGASRLQSLPDIAPHQVSAECAVVGE